LKRAAVFALAIATTVVIAPAGAGATSAPAYDDDTVIVRYRPTVTATERRPLLERIGELGRTLERIEGVGARVVAVNGDPAEVARRLEQSPKVAYAEPNFLVQAQGRLPNDTLFRQQWALRNVGQTGGKRGADIHAVKGWRRLRVARYKPRGGVKVGLIDTGVEFGHPDLIGRVRGCAESRPRPAGFTGNTFVRGSCEDDTGHGTHIAGIVGARADNGAGIAGVAFNSPLVVCRALGGPDQTGRVSDVARCLRWVRSRGAKVVSMSFATGQRSQTLHRAVRKAWRHGRRKGAVLVSAAGNGGFNLPSYPAAYSEVISVAATTDRDTHASFSNHHKTVDVAAPGVGILSTFKGGGYTRLAGTSQAVPHVAGIAAQLRRRFSKATAREIRKRIRRTATDLGPRGRDPRFGYGRVNLAQAAKP
jgi:thermitase